MWRFFMCYFNVFFLFVMLRTSALLFGGWLSYFLEMLFGLYKKSPADSSGESRGLTHIIYSLLSFCQVSDLTCCFFYLATEVLFLNLLCIFLKMLFLVLLVAEALLAIAFGVVSSTLS